MSLREISAGELRDLMSRGEVTLVDIREPWEAEICSIAGGTLVPMRSLPQRLQEIPPERPVALYCHHGVRSLMAAKFLAQNGFDALSLRGGIARWADEVEPGMKRY